MHALELPSQPLNQVSFAPCSLAYRFQIYDTWCSYRQNYQLLLNIESRFTFFVERRLIDVPHRSVGILLSFIMRMVSIPLLHYRRATQYPKARMSNNNVIPVFGVCVVNSIYVVFYCFASNTPIIIVSLHVIIIIIINIFIRHSNEFVSISIAFHWKHLSSTAVCNEWFWVLENETPFVCFNNNIINL